MSGLLTLHGCPTNSIVAEWSQIPSVMVQNPVQSFPRRMAVTITAEWGFESGMVLQQTHMDVIGQVPTYFLQRAKNWNVLLVN